MPKQKEDEVEKIDLQFALKSLETVYGAGVVIKLDGPVTERERLPSGSLLLDDILGGGFVKGSLHELWGAESTGKSTISMHTMVEAQKIGKVLLVDTEYSFDPTYAASIGLTINDLYVCQPTFAEQAFTVIETIANTGEFSLIVVDSIAGLSPRAEVEGDSGDANMGLIAKLCNQHLRKVIQIAHKNKTTIIYTNQKRSKLGGWGGYTRPGGLGFNHFCSTIIELTRTSTVVDSVKRQSIVILAKAVKNKTGIPFKSTDIDIGFGIGVDHHRELITIGLKNGTVTKSGSWFYLGETKLGQGADKAAEFLRSNPELNIQILPEKTDACN